MNTRNVQPDWIMPFVLKGLPLKVIPQVAMNAGDLVVINGLDGITPTVRLATAEDYDEIIYVAGATHGGPGAPDESNSSFAFPWRILRSIDTSSLTAGAALYADAAGAYTETRGDSPRPIGKVLVSDVDDGAVLLAPNNSPVQSTMKAVTIASIAAPLTVTFPFTVAEFTVQVRKASGVISTGIDTYAIVGGDIVITFNGGGAPDIIVGDVVTFHASA